MVVCDGSGCYFVMVGFFFDWLFDGVLIFYVCVGVLWVVLRVFVI